MKKLFLFPVILLCSVVSSAQNCKTTADLDAAPGIYRTASQYPYPAVRSAYFQNLLSSADKQTARQTLAQLELLEQQSRSGFTLTGGHWENYISSSGYLPIEKIRPGVYSLQSAFYEFFCINGKQTRNSEYSTVLRMYVNSIPVQTLAPILRNPFGSSMPGSYDLGYQFADWKNHQSAHVNDPLIRLFNYLACANTLLIRAINERNNYFQDVEEKNVIPNNRSVFVTRYWFAGKNEMPILVPVSRKEYLESLLEFYEREKLQFPALVKKLTAEHDNSVKQYSGWETDVTDKINVVKKVLAENSAAWLQEQAIINLIEDNGLTYKAGLNEKTNINRFWNFYSTEKKSEPLYKYNPAYFSSQPGNAAKPLFIVAAFRYVTMPSSLRLVNNFTQHFDFNAIKEMLGP